jgi:hypothetical protein
MAQFSRRIWILGEDLFNPCSRKNIKQNLSRPCAHIKIREMLRGVFNVLELIKEEALTIFAPPGKVIITL